MSRDKYLDHLRAVPMFSACSTREINLLGRLVEHLAVPAGTELVQEGRAGSEFYVITSGTARVSRQGQPIADLGTGDSFGELALLDAAPRNATVTATTDLTAAMLGAREFQSALVDIPTLTRKIMIGMARRLHELDARTASLLAG